MEGHCDRRQARQEDLATPVGAACVTHASKVFVADDFDNDKVTVEFWMAKAFGVHTYVGKAKITFESIDGHVVRFKWMNG